MCIISLKTKENRILVTSAALKLNFCKTNLKTTMIWVRQNPILLKFLMDTVDSFY